MGALTRDEVAAAVAIPQKLTKTSEVPAPTLDECSFLVHFADKASQNPGAVCVRPLVNVGEFGTLPEVLLEAKLADDFRHALAIAYLDALGVGG